MVALVAEFHVKLVFIFVSRMALIARGQSILQKGLATFDGQTGLVNLCPGILY